MYRQQLEKDAAKLVKLPKPEALGEATALEPPPAAAAPPPVASTSAAAPDSNGNAEDQHKGTAENGSATPGTEAVAPAVAPGTCHLLYMALELVTQHCNAGRKDCAIADPSISLAPVNG